MKHWIFILLLKWIHIEGKEDYYYSYDYSDDPLPESFRKGGQRIVGAKRAEFESMPFLVGFDMGVRRGTHPRPNPRCTGALITKDWVVTAAHCILSVINREQIPECLTQTKDKGQYVLGINEVKCEPAGDGHVKIYPMNPFGRAYLGLENINEGNKDLEVTDIEYFVYHNSSYRGGGGYFDFGGYDITLLKLANQSKHTPACIPRANFVDSGLGTVNGKEGAKIAGYGMFMREPCMTDEYGDYKYHYCVEGSACDNSTSPPIPPVCQKFFDHKETPNSIPTGLTEIIVSDEDGDHYCYREASPKEGSKGWCHVEIDASNLGGWMEVKSWGFCSQDCYLYEKEEPKVSVLRTLDNVHILGNGLCERYLKMSLEPNVTVRPEILCIGHKEELKYEHWGKTKEGDFYKSLDKSSFVHKFSAYPETKVDYYIKSAGTCNGDSGGPVFVSRDGKHIVLGVVSGGRGYLGKCGGINNPTHYVRVKKLSDWITAMLGNDAKDLCWFNKNGLEKKKL